MYECVVLFHIVISLYMYVRFQYRYKYNCIYRAPHVYCIFCLLYLYTGPGIHCWIFCRLFCIVECSEHYTGNHIKYKYQYHMSANFQSLQYMYIPVRCIPNKVITKNKLTLSLQFTFAFVLGPWYMTSLDYLMQSYSQTISMKSVLCILGT